MRNTRLMRENREMRRFYMFYILLKMPLTWIILAFVTLLVMFPEGSNMDLLMSFIATIFTIAVSKAV